MRDLEKRKLGELMNFIPGVNTTRAEKQLGNIEINYYDQASFEIDYTHENNIKQDKVEGVATESIPRLRKGDVIISNALRKATIVGVNNVGKIPTLNYTKVEMDETKFDKRYFLYLFNVSNNVERQKEKELTGLSTKQRLSLKSMKELSVPVPAIEEQRKIGEMYIEVIKMQSYLKRYLELMKQLMMTVVEERLEGE